MRFVRFVKSILRSSLFTFIFNFFINILFKIKVVLIRFFFFVLVNQINSILKKEEEKIVN